MASKVVSKSVSKLASPGFDLDQALALWALPPDTEVALINVSENRTYLITQADGTRTVLREHRPNYHAPAAIESELNWLQAARIDCDISVPVVIHGVNGKPVQTIKCLDEVSQRLLVMFEFLEGVEPEDDGGVLDYFETLGGIAARLHVHATQWLRPESFVRRHWNSDTVLGEQAPWGHWRNGPGVNASNIDSLSKLEHVLIQRLSRLGTDSDVYGLIHADMRHANILVNGDTTHVIDFDDCGFGWYLYDFATTVSFIEDHPQMDQFKARWLQGYRQHHALSAEYEHEMDTFILFRRLALLGWMGSHPDVEIVQALSPAFAQNSVLLAKRYLSVFC